MKLDHQDLRIWSGKPIEERFLDAGRFVATHALHGNVLLDTHCSFYPRHLFFLWQQYSKILPQSLRFFVDANLDEGGGAGPVLPTLLAPSLATPGGGEAAAVPAAGPPATTISLGFWLGLRKVQEWLQG